MRMRREWIGSTRSMSVKEKSGQALFEDFGEVGSLEGFWRSCGHWQTLATNSPVLVCPHILCPHMWCPHIVCPHTHFVHTYWVMENIGHSSGTSSGQIKMRVYLPYLAKRGFHQMVLNFQAHTDSTPGCKMLSRGSHFFAQTLFVKSFTFSFTFFTLLL